MKWQRVARLVIAVLAVAFAVGVGFTMKRRTTPRSAAPVPRTDPTALVESAGGNTIRLTGEHEDARIEYKRLLSYANGSSKMVGVTITSTRGAKTFVVTGGEGQAGEGDSSIELSGGVRMQVSDGMVLTADTASYSKAAQTVHVPGAATFARGHLAGSGTGLVYDQAQDVITIADNAVVNVTPDAEGVGAMTLTSGGLEFRRADALIRMDRDAKITRDRQLVEADLAVAHLSEDQQRLETLELRTNSRITSTPSGPGGLESMSARDIDLRYGPDGQTLQHALLTANAVVRLAGERPDAGRRISASTIDVSLAADGATPISLVGRENVTVTLPGEAGGATRTITAQTLDGTGDGTHGLTGAHFTGSVQFAEQGPGVDRAVRSAVLDAAMAPGFGALDDATFTKGVRFADGPMFATSAAARYLLGKGVVELTGSEPGSVTPHVVNEQISVEATRIDITLDGPLMKASGSVKSVLQPKKAEGGASASSHLPSMLKQDQPVNVTGAALNYDGSASHAVYSGGALLWQSETSIKGATITIDSNTGNLSSTGPVTTSSLMLQDDGKGNKSKVNSIGAAKDFAYEDASRKATYTGNAHLTGPQGDLTAPRIELFLLPSGDELDRAEGYEGITLRGDGRKTTGQRLTFFGADQRYLVTGTPVTIIDECGRETTGRTLTFFRTTDRIVVDGNEQVRTQTNGKTSGKTTGAPATSSCP